MPRRAQRQTWNPRQDEVAVRMFRDESCTPKQIAERLNKKPDDVRRHLVALGAREPRQTIDTTSKKKVLR